jgi:hypothetical protein
VNGLAALPEGGRKTMVVIERNMAITSRKILLVALLAMVVVPGVGLFVHLTKGQDPALSKVLENGRTVAAGGKDGKIRLWDVQTGKLKATFKRPGWGWLWMSEVYSLAFSPDGKILASTGQDQKVRLWKTPLEVAD